MSSLNTSFSRTNRIFENARRMSLVRHEIEFPLAANIIQISSRLFQILDRSDSVQTEISRRLWVLRSTVLFTFLPFNDSDLKLELQMKELKFAAESIPETSTMIESLGKCISEILTYPSNPKREWLNHHISESAKNVLEKTGILTALSAGKTPGWPIEKTTQLKELIGSIIPIASRKTLKSNIFQNIILPCACNNVSSLLLTDLLFSGIASTFDILLYPGEKFHIPKRLMLPDDDLFSSRLQKSEIEREVLMVSGNGSAEEDSWLNEAFWQGLHGANRTSSYGLSPARYILFYDGAGVFLPADGRVITLPADGNVRNEADLDLLPVGNISEGDIVVLRSGDSGSLLDNASERIMGRADNESLLETATNWKEPLDALLLTHTCADVVKELAERGISTRVASIHQWVGPEVLGPGDERVFRELINLLADKGKIQKSGVDLTSYADKCWHGLQVIRGLHQKAGNLIRQDLFKALFKKFGNRSAPVTFSDRDTIHIEGDTDAELLIMRVNSVDTNVAYVPQSRLGKIDDLKGNKWLG